MKEKVAVARKAGIEDNANRADRLLNRIKRKAHEELQAGKPESDILTDLARERVRCPC